MQNTSMENKQGSRRWLLVSVFALTFCVLISSVMLASQLGVFTHEEIQTTVELMPKSESRDAYDQTNDIPASNVHTGSNTVAGFESADDQQIWTNNTQLEIFKVSYKNGENTITALSKNGDKIVAPGTANDYSFVLNNTGDTAIDYTMNITAYISDNITSIPVQVKLKDYTGKYLVGSETAWQSILDLNNITDSAVLSAGYHATYTLGWQWPFEGDDAFDTLLGNMAEDEEYILTVQITTMATADAVADTGSGQPPKTGDSFNIILWSAIAVLSFFTMLLLLLWKRRDEKEDAHET